MILSKAKRVWVSKRLKKVEGTQSGACHRAGISKQVGTKIMTGGECEKETIDKFLTGVEEEIAFQVSEIHRLNSIPA
jgi:hypothetical protein